MWRPEIIRPPFCPGSDISVIENSLVNGHEGYLFVLPNGERLAFSRSQNSRGVCDFPKSLSMALTQTVLRRYSSGHREDEDRLSENEFVIRACDVLWRQFGLGRLDAEIWAKELVNQNPDVDKVFPHWLFISILANCQDRRLGYGLGPPQFVVDQPSLDQLNKVSIGEKGLQQFREKTPPTLVGTAVPILGNFGSNNPSFIRQEEIYTLLRQREGDLATGKFSFPGGGSDRLLELTALDELREELDILRLEDGGAWPQRVFEAIRRMDFLLVADQTLIDKQGQLRRFLNYVFAVWLSFPYSGGGRGWVSIRESINRIKAYPGDGLDQWQPAMINSTGKILDRKFKENLSPIASLSVRALEKLLYNRWR